MYCWNCGTRVPGAAAFCHRCGQSQAADAEFDPAAEPIAPDGWPWTTAGSTADAAEVEAVASFPVAPLRSVVVDLPSEARDSPDEALEHASSVPNRLAGVLALGCGAAVVAGSFGPWLTARIRLDRPMHFDGTDWDGGVTSACGLAAVVCLALLLASPQRSGFGFVAAAAFAVAALVGIADWSNAVAALSDLRRLGMSALLGWEVGWGLRAVTFGGLAGAILATAQALQARRVA